MQVQYEGQCAFLNFQEDAILIKDLIYKFVSVRISRLGYILYLYICGVLPQNKENRAFRVTHLLETRFRALLNFCPSFVFRDTSKLEQY